MAEVPRASSPSDRPAPPVMPSPCYAAVDAGSNTFRLLVARPGDDGRDLVFLHARREITRLGMGLERKHTLDPDAARHGLDVLRSFAEDIKRLGAAWTVAVGTGALRGASDGARMVEAAAAETGLVITIVDQPTEALLTLLGAGLVFGEETPLAVVDVGGKSTEIIARTGRGQPMTAGFPLGVVALKERFIYSDPPPPGAAAAMRAFIEGVLSGPPLPSALPEELPLVGTGGTITTLAAVDQGLTVYDRGRINRHRLTRARVARLLDLFLSLDEKCRAALPGLEPGRADVIIPGAVLALALMDRLGRGEMTVSDAGILEGCILAGLRGDPPLPKTVVRDDQR